jgi:hypothetical protein
MSDVILPPRSASIAETPPQVAYVDWAPILAGASVAVAISTVMTTFGAAIGLSATSPISGSTMSTTAWIVATAIWVLWIAVSSFVAGGYLAGRMRRRIHDATEHESDVRDGVHGLVVWAIGALLLGYLAASSITGLTKTIAGTAATGTMSAIAGAANPIDDAVNHIMRAGASAKPSENDNFRQDVSGILTASAANGAITDEDKAYLSQQIASHIGLSLQDAAKRVDDAMAAVNSAKEKAKQAAETARKIGVLVAFLTAASLAVSAAAAWWAATTGGKHRDEGVDLSHLTNWR